MAVIGYDTILECLTANRITIEVFQEGDSLKATVKAPMYLNSEYTMVHSWSLEFSEQEIREEVAAHIAPAYGVETKKVFYIK